MYGDFSRGTFNRVGGGPTGVRTGPPGDTLRSGSSRTELYDPDPIGLRVGGLRTAVTPRRETPLTSRPWQEVP